MEGPVVPAQGKPLRMKPHETAPQQSCNVLGAGHAAGQREALFCDPNAIPAPWDALTRPHFRALESLDTFGRGVGGASGKAAHATVPTCRDTQTVD